MSESVRTSNLFAGQNYDFIFQAYQFIDYTAYDYDTLKQALINYVRTYYPEDFTDYTESSEFIAIIELIAYLGTSLAFRTDLNARENFIDTAERRESIIRLAKMVNYVPSRNLAANGLFKFSAVSTTQPTIDTSGNQISNLQVFWNDPNNTDWFDQFIQILNQAFNPTNPFGKPSKSGIVGSIPSDLYTLNNILKQNITYPTSLSINGQSVPIDVVNPDFDDLKFFERLPDPNNAMNFIYRNDSLGVSSANTGFFFYFRQGTMFNIDTNFSFPVPNRLFDITNQNINNTDVYVQETDEQGNVLSQWKQVPELAGQNIIYNSIQYGERNIFDVLTNTGDTVSIRFPDGNFGNVPTGLFRFWVRVSANQYLTIRPENAQGLKLTIPYIGADNQVYNLTITYDLEYTVTNGAPTETNEQIKQRAPAIYSTQDRMVNGSDYNVLPLIYGNQIDKIKAVDRTYSGQSRYIDTTDPTGFHRDLLIFGQDGALFRDNNDQLTTITDDGSNPGKITALVLDQIQSQLRDTNLQTFFYDEYLKQFESKVRVLNPATGTSSLLDLTNTNPLYGGQIFWKTSPSKARNTTGYFTHTPGGPITDFVLLANTSGVTYAPYSFIKTGATVVFADTPSAVPVNNVIQYGEPLDVTVTNVGPVELGDEVQTSSQGLKVFPVFRTELNTNELNAITDELNNGSSFWLYYDLLLDTWGVSEVSSSTPAIDQSFVYPAPPASSIYSNFSSSPTSWLLYVEIVNTNQSGIVIYDVTTRGRSFVFESYRDVRFYWEPNQIVIDSSTGLALQDTIEVMPLINTNSTIDNNDPVITNPTTAFLKVPVNFNISGVFTQDDGYQDPAKVQVSLVDNNSDGIPDDPSGIDRIISLNDRVIFELYTNELSGYESSRPWIAQWATDLENVSTSLYVHIPSDPSDPTVADIPYISTSASNGSGNTATATAIIAGGQIIDIVVTDGAGPEYTSATVTILGDGVGATANAITGGGQVTSIMITNAGSGYTYANVIISPPITVVYMNDTDLLFVNNETLTNSIAEQLTGFFNESVSSYPWLANTPLLTDKRTILNSYFLNKSYAIVYDENNVAYSPGYGLYKALVMSPTDDINLYPTGQIIDDVVDTAHFDKNGKVFTQNTTIDALERKPFYFKWSHFSPIDQRVDPSPSNIIDMIVLTDPYYQEVLTWKNKNGSLNTMPVPPTTEELRSNFSGLDDYKMVSDALVWNSGKFKLLFGPQATTELQASFLVVKSPTSNTSDNEIKTRVVQAIDTYFDIRNWDFGETFFYTELAAYIHQQLSKVISSVVIVPKNSNSQFGNLFEIVSAPNELFLSTATVSNVQIVSNLTEQNLRV